jgi:hypothetical protein
MIGGLDTESALQKTCGFVSRERNGRELRATFVEVRRS